jgi:bacterioferritin
MDRYAKKKTELARNPKPYPPIKVLEPNIEYALILHDALAGRVSEMTAITQYLYHHWDMGETLEETSQLLEDISIVEMEHMEILAELIVLLGGTPIYHDSICGMWSPEYVEYLPQTPLRQLIADIEAEKAAIDIYRYQIAIIHDPYIQAILKRIIRDEEVHLSLFKAQLQNISLLKNL